MIKNEPGVLGLSREFSAVLLVEEGVGRCIVELDSTVSFLAVDLSDASLADMREYDPVTDSTEPILPYDVNEPYALPKVSTVLTLIVEWIETLASERLNLYSARDEHENGPTPAPRKVSPKKAGTAGKATLASLASQLVSMQQQLQVVVAQQGAMTRDQSGMGGAAIHAPVPSPGPMVGKVPALSSGLLAGTAPKTAANLVGPPPRTKAVPQPVPDVGLQAGPIQGSYAGGVDSQVVNTLTQQSTSLTQLVAHLTGGDPISDLASSSSGTGLSLNTRGVARREKMQNDLAMRSSNYFLQVQQQREQCPKAQKNWGRPTSQ